MNGIFFEGDISNVKNADPLLVMLEILMTILHTRIIPDKKLEICYKNTALHVFNKGINFMQVFFL
jgi:hypothetical protein